MRRRNGERSGARRGNDRVGAAGRRPQSTLYDRVCFRKWRARRLDGAQLAITGRIECENSQILGSNQVIIRVFREEGGGAGGQGAPAAAPVGEEGNL